MPETETAARQSRVETADGVMRITLDRPEALNPLGLQMAGEVLEAVRAAGEDEAVRALLITGAGRGFSSGADLGGSDRPMTPEGKPDVLTGLREVYNPLILAVREIPKPVIAAVNGAAAGIGCSLALACDQIVASSSSYFLLAFANVGLTIDGGASVFLPARIGQARASEMALLAEKVPAERALEWGMVNRVVDDERVVEEGEALALRLAAGPTGSYAASKRLVHEAVFGDLAEQLDREAIAQQQRAESEDFVEGVLAFMQKRSPEFKGR